MVRFPSRIAASLGGSMDNDIDSRVQPSEGEALVRLGLKFLLGPRGEYIAEYLDDRRRRRVSERIAELGRHAEEAGASVYAVVERLHEDDETAEYLEEIIEVAAGTRYARTLQYLGGDV